MIVESDYIGLSAKLERVRGVENMVMSWAEYALQSCRAIIPYLFPLGFHERTIFLVAACVQNCLTRF